MALHRALESEDDDEEYHSLAGEGAAGMPKDDSEQHDMDAVEPPVHPVASMQGAFEESIVESACENGSAKPPSGADAEARRRQLLETKHYDDVWTTRWTERPGAQHHPLLKLISQIVFGMHLLQQQQAKSDDEVVKIMQTHVNDVDSFLERTSEDFDFAIADIEERIRHLKLPMQHLNVFDSMLADRSFRTQLLDGNDKIERIIDRTARAMDGALMDVQKGQHAVQELGKYLGKVRHDWPRGKKSILDVYGAMCGNEKGWMKYLGALQKKSGNLGRALFELGTVIGEMSKLAAAASRRNRPTSHMSKRGSRSTPNSPFLRSKFSQDTSPTIVEAAPSKACLNKPLPQAPDSTPRAAENTHSVPLAHRYEHPRALPYLPPSTYGRDSRDIASHHSCPETAGAVKESQYPKLGTCDLKEFLKTGGPLRSNPPDKITVLDSSTRDMKLSHSQLSIAAQTVNAVPPRPVSPSIPVHDPDGNAAQAGTAPTSVSISDATANAAATGTLMHNSLVARSKTAHGSAIVVNATGPRTSKLPDKQKRRMERDRETERPWTRQNEMESVSTRKESSQSERASRKDSVVTASNSLARRISKRMKHLPPPDCDEEAHFEKAGQRKRGLSAINRARSATAELERPFTTDGQSDARRPNTPNDQSTTRPAHVRQPSKLELFPRTAGSSTAVQSSLHDAFVGTLRVPQNSEDYTVDANGTLVEKNITALPSQCTSAPAKTRRTSTRSSSRARSALGSVRGILGGSRGAKACLPPSEL